MDHQAPDNHLKNKVIPTHLARIIAIGILIVTLVDKIYSQGEKPFKEVESIPRSKAMIYVYSLSNNLFGSDLIEINGKLLSYLPVRKNGCLIYITEPGNYILKPIRMGSGKMLRITINEQESLFIKCIKQSGRDALELIPAEIARKELKKCSLIEKQFTVSSPKYKTIILASTMFSQPEIPAVPFIDAAFVRKEVNNNIGKIIEIEQNNLSALKSQTAMELAKYFNARVLFVDSLNEESEIVSLNQKFNKIYKDDINEISYPIIIADSIDLKPLPYFTYPRFKNGEDLHIFFENTENLTPVWEISKCINTDLTAMVVYYFSFDMTGGITDLGINARILLMSHAGKVITNTTKKMYVKFKYNTFEQDIFDAVNLFPCVLPQALEEITYRISSDNLKN